MTTRLERNLTAGGATLMILLGIALLLWPIVSSADTALHKAGRGLAEITTPFLEIPGNIKQTTDRDGAPAGWTEGFAKGLGMAIIRPPVGVYELVTAPIPAPANYEPILKPEYPWSYFGSREEQPGVVHHHGYR
jgi:putative exosortase-associated protein (TIGR04073 family)